MKTSSGHVGVYMQALEVNMESSKSGENYDDGVQAEHHTYYDHFTLLIRLSSLRSWAASKLSSSTYHWNQYQGNQVISNSVLLFTALRYMIYMFVNEATCNILAGDRTTVFPYLENTTRVSHRRIQKKSKEIITLHTNKHVSKQDSTLTVHLY